MSGQNALNNEKAQRDAIAKQNGFPSWEAMVGFDRHRMQSLQNSNTTARKPPAQPAPARPAERQPNEGVFGYIMRKMSGG